MEDHKLLLKLARESISTYLERKEPEDSYAKHLNQKQGCFVTLKKHGELRGCIGFPQATHVLYHAIIEAARSAAFGDPRFPPLLKQELDHIKIEISLLTKPELIRAENPEDYIKQVRIGKDGLMMKPGGLLLPQVAIEQGWNATEFLNGLCEKSGMPHDAWKDLENKIYRFQAIVFSE